MAFITEQAGPIASVGAPLLARSLVLPMTVTRVSGGDFSGPSGDTVTVRVPQPHDSNEQARGGGNLTPSEINEVPVTLQVKHIYDLVNLDEYQLNMDIETFASQVTRIQAEAVARGAENKIATVMNALSSDLEFAATASAADTEDIIIQAREALSAADAPASGRWLACSPSIYSRLLAVEKFVRVDASGAASALREANVGRIFGMNVIESNALTDDTAVAYHQSGFVFANFAPQNPRGATSSGQTQSQGIAIRQLFQYNAANATEQSLLSTFAGASAVADNESANSLDDFPRSVKIAVGS